MFYSYFYNIFLAVCGVGVHSCFPGTCLTDDGDAKAACTCDTGFTVDSPVSRYECHSK